MRALQYLWAAPATAVGLFLLLAAHAAGARSRIVDGTVEVSGSCVKRAVQALPRCLQFHAITFGHVIIGVDDAQLAACRDHERVHVRQYERWGLLFFPLYLGSSLVQLARGGDPYWDNHFERQARARSAPAVREGARA